MKCVAAAQDDPAWRSNPDGAPDADERDSLAAQYLQVPQPPARLPSAAPHAPAASSGACSNSAPEDVPFEAEPHPRADGRAARGGADGGLHQ